MFLVIYAKSDGKIELKTLGELYRSNQQKLEVLSPDSRQCGIPM